MHPQDLARLRLKEGDLVHLTSRRGSIILPVQASERVATTQAFVAMHWGEEFLSGKTGHQHGSTGINAITTRAYCPISKQPELKHSAIKVLKAELPWRLTAMAWFSDDELPQMRRQLQALLAHFDYAALVPFGHQRNGLLLRAAAAELPEAELVLEIEALFALDASQPSVLRYEDKKRGQRRALRMVTVEGERRLDAFLLAGDESAQGWMRSMLQTEQATPSQAHRLLAAGAKPPADTAPTSPQVCNCFNINADQINTLLSRCTGSADERLVQLQGELKCGTQCGSCLPSLRERVRLSLAAA